MKKAADPLQLKITDSMVKALQVLHRVGPTYLRVVRWQTLRGLRRRKLIKGDPDGRVILSERGLSVLKERGHA